MSIPINAWKSVGLPHDNSAEEVLADLNTNAHTGLTSQETQERRLRCGPNILRTSVQAPAWRRFLLQFRDPQVALLLAAAAVSIVVSTLESSSPISYEAFIILAIVVLNAALGFAQEDRAEHALASLRRLTPPEATVIRDGKQQRLLARDLVPGDLLVIGEGDLIPADARLLETQSLQTMEATLTGESLPVLKTTAPLEPGTPIGDRSNMIFAGTQVLSGNARAIVTATGILTEFGKIAELIHREDDKPTPLQRQLKHLSKQLSIAVVLIAVVVVATLLAVHGFHGISAVMDILLFGIALAVAATPEGLSAVITLVLAIGVQKMARRGAIVRKLPAVETLGSTTVIACDKTGTLTRNEMTVRTIVTSSGCVELDGIGYAPEGSLTGPRGQNLPDDQWSEINRLLLGATLANNAQLDKGENGWRILGDPTEAALLTAARKANLIPSTIQNDYPRLFEVAFSSERKMMTTVHADNEISGGAIAFTKGAPEVLLAHCTHEYSAGNAHPLHEKRRREILRANERLTENALRTLGVAMRTRVLRGVLNPAIVDASTIERDLTFLGLVGMMDPPRPEARTAVERARVAGIRTVLITGDHPRTAAAVAKELDILTNDRVVSGAQLDEMTEEELVEAVRDTSVYARVNPEHKLRIIHALERNNEIVAMTGDGVNDAPALKAAHIGIAMGITGTDVSKEAADLILTDDNFATIVAAIEEGRAIFDNIRKFLRYLLATNLGEVLTIFLSAVFLSLRNPGFAQALVLPLSAVQILWINLVTDGAPALALGRDTPAADIMLRPPRNAHERLINRRETINLIMVGMVMTIGTMSMFFVLTENTSLAYSQSMAFTTLILFQLINALSARSDCESAFHHPLRNHWLVGAIVLSACLQALLLTIPFSRHAFGTTMLNLTDWLLCIAVASSVLWVSEGEKYIFRRGIRVRSGVK